MSEKLSERSYPLEAGDLLVGVEKNDFPIEDRGDFIKHGVGLRGGIALIEVFWQE